MDEPRLFEVQGDYAVPLLRLILESPNGQGRTADLFSRFFDKYESWIPEQHRGLLEDGRMFNWQKKLEFIRHNLVKLGLMDSPKIGIWRITEAGRHWLEDNPNATRLDSTSRRATRTTSQSSPRTATVRRRGRNPKPAIPAPTLTLEMLEQTRQAMGDQQFRPLWGEVYDQLLAIERAKTITDVSDKDLRVSARAMVQQIQDYLQGQGNQRPSAEQLCDWIHFCYQFSLYREAAALLTHVNKDDVNDWYYERTRKIAAASHRRI